MEKVIVLNAKKLNGNKKCSKSFLYKKVGHVACVADLLFAEALSDSPGVC